MERKGRILVLDDLERWREGLRESLEDAGFYVDTASTVAEAKERLAASFYHMAVLDVNMNDEQGNEEGIELLRELSEYSLSGAIRIVMISAYGTKSMMRMAFARYGVADFFDKRGDEGKEKEGFDDLEFAQRVQEIFDEEVPSNLKLNIGYENTAPERLVVNLKVGDGRVEDGTPLQAALAAELEDLLCRLFRDADSIVVRPITPGLGGASVLRVQPFYKEQGGAGQSVIVKFGDYRKIDPEHFNFKTYVEPFTGHRSTTVRGLGRTPQLGGIIYSLVGTASDTVESFGSLYARADLPRIKEVIDGLFNETCSAWYANPGWLIPHDLTADYQRLLNFQQGKIDKALDEELGFSPERQELQFDSFAGRAFTNPATALAGKKFIPATYVTITHGDFNKDNILVDAHGQSWLIDFLRTGRGHILRDFAELDSVVRIQLLATQEATLQERLEMEETLRGVKRFSEVSQLDGRLKTENQALAKAYATAVHLRKVAQQMVAKNPSDDIGEYNVALFYYALNMTRFNTLSRVQREHALLCASLLADRLKG